ncbi:MAG: hypothetical protein JNL53_05570 [Cyclobacteriaceae bacterium]|nr:hypothetical protein [Cyclobacteriaceae bacterium]
MKKLFFVGTFIFALIITACQNENSVNPRPTDQIVSTVNIKGRVKAELNTTNAVLENAPAGLKIVAEVNTRDLVLNPTGGNYPTKYFEATVDANGEYTIGVDVGPYGNNVKLYFPDFRADVATGAATVSTLFTGSTRTVSVVKGQDKILDFNY